MASLNKVLLMGNLTRDPQLKYLPSNTPVVELGLAVTRRFKKANGEQAEETMFIDCNAFGRTAEVINQYFKKGDPIFLEGRLQLDQWQDKDGNKRSKHRIHIDSFEFIASRREGGGPGGGGGGGGGGDGGEYRSQPSGRSSGGSGGSGGRSAPPPEPPAEFDGDDIPF
jgi:single-strand DNA-binding protein